MNTLESSGVALWTKAKQLIPGGNQLLSKRAERFLPDLWPAYYSRAKGCEVWDLDDVHYYDFAQMGVGSCTVGYADPDINAAVSRAIDLGNMSSLNCAEEVQLAEKLIELHPWGEMLRFARTGGEGCAIAIRIARAAAGKTGVAFCGYHGWHDWYISANLGDAANLDGQLLPGLAPSGIHRGLRGSAVPFQYNDLASLQCVVDDPKNAIGVIVMEPERGAPPSPGFLEGVRQIADRVGAVLVFDEVTSGFRVNVGGIHMTLDVEPDVAVLGKGMANGYALAAIIGRRSVMDHAQDTFISSTFWTERIGFTAGLATIDKFERCNVPEHLIAHGNRIIVGLQQIATRHGIDLSITGIAPLIYMNFTQGEPQEVQTFYAQEMLAKGYLLGGAIYTTYAYNTGIIDGFLQASDEVFGRLRTHLERSDLANQLRGRVIQTGFARLT